MATQNTYTGQIAAKLGDYRSRGHKEAGKHRPPTTATAPDQHESELKSIGDGWLTKVQQQFDKVITEASRSSTEARQKFIELQATFDQLLRDDTATSTVDAELAGERTALVNATEARVRAEVELRYFKAANDIHEEAKYPESKINHIGWLLAIGLLEAIVNGFFYENAQGLLGGVMVAAGIAALNILAGFGFGIGFRNINLAAIEKKVVGWGCLAAFTLLAILCNSLFAAFRSEYQLILDPSDYAQVTQAFQRALPNALAIFKLEIRFQDHWSFLLFGLGMVASAIAFYKGYTFDDKYPGYGVKDRRYRAALETEQSTEVA